MLYTVLAFVAGVYVGKAHYDQFVALVKSGWAKLKGLFSKKPVPTPTPTATAAK